MLVGGSLLDSFLFCCNPVLVFATSPTHCTLCTCVDFFLLLPSFQSPAQVGVAIQVFQSLGQFQEVLLSFVEECRVTVQREIQEALDPATLTPPPSHHTHGMLTLPPPSQHTHTHGLHIILTTPYSCLLPHISLTSCPPSHP